LNTHKGIKNVKNNDKVTIKFIITEKMLLMLQLRKKVPSIIKKSNYNSNGIRSNALLSNFIMYKMIIIGSTRCSATV